MEPESLFRGWWMQLLTIRIGWKREAGHYSCIQTRSRNTLVKPWSSGRPIHTSKSPVPHTVPSISKSTKTQSVLFNVYTIGHNRLANHVPHVSQVQKMRRISDLLEQFDTVRISKCMDSGLTMGMMSVHWGWVGGHWYSTVPWMWSRVHFPGTVKNNNSYGADTVAQQAKLLLAMPVFYVREQDRVPTIPLPVQLLGDVLGKASKDGPGHPCRRPGWSWWLWFQVGSARSPAAFWGES